MLKIGKKFLCTLLVVVLCLTSAPLQGFVDMKWPKLPEINFGKFFVEKASAIEDRGYCGDQVTYTYDSTTGKVVITGRGEMKNYSGITSPFYNSNVKSVVIEEGVTSVGEYAFWKCANLTDVTLPESITVIGFKAFAECSSLLSIKLPDSLKTIESYAFSRCTNLNNITIPSGVTMIKASAFEVCSSLTEFVFPNSMTSIYGGLFVDCYSLISITIPKSITSINEYAFRHCNSLTDIYYLGSEDDWNTIEFIADNDVISNATIHFAEGIHTHTPESVVIRSTCTETGMQYDICTFCGEILSDVIFLPAGHSPGEWEIVTKPSYETEGKKQKKCTVCDEVLEIESIPRNDELDYLHPFGDYSNDYGSIHWEFDKITGKLIISGKGMLYGGVFSDCNAIKSVVIEEGFTSIYEYVFYECTNLERIDISNTVTSIEYCAFSNCKALTEVILPDSIMNIGLYAFSDCTSLLSVIIPNGVTNIGQSAFSGCTNLRDVTIPESVTDIGYGAFLGCTNIDNVYASDIKSWCNINFANIDSNPLSNGANLYFNGTIVKNIVIPNNITTIKTAAFASCEGIFNIVLSNSVTSIGQSAFYGCSSVQSITLSDSIIQIDKRAFYNCSGIINITIPDSVVSLGEEAFYGCAKLKNITIPASVQIHKDAFGQSLEISDITITKGSGTMKEFSYECTYEYTPWYVARNNDLSIIVSEGITNIASKAFSGCTGLKSIVLPNSLETIGVSSFSDCTGIETIQIPDSVTNIGDYAFSQCSNLSDITIPASVQYSANTFKNCTAVSNIIISKGTGAMTSYSNTYKYTPWYISRENELSIVVSDGVIDISSNAFYDCTGLKSIVLPDSLTSIGSNSFYRCSNLTSVEIPDNVKTIGNYAFASCAKMNKITIPAGIEMFSGAFSSNISEVEFTEGNGEINRDTESFPWLNARKIVIRYGVKTISENAFSSCKKLETISMPNSVTYIGKTAFYNCTSLTDITIPKSVVAINESTFNSCISLISVNLPTGLKDIGANAFYNCSKLAELVIPETLETIGDEAFANCSGMFNVYIPNGVKKIGKNAFSNCSGISTVKIPNSLQVIEIGTFSGCKGLTELNLGYNVTTIGDRAFAGCSSLTDVIIPNSVTNIGERGFKGCSSLTNLTISDSVNNIGSYAFDDCSGLSYISIPASVQYSANTFENCTGISNIVISKGTGKMSSYTYATHKYTPWYISRNNNINVTIQYGVKNIGSWSFAYCVGLKNIIIPDSVTVIEEYAFYGCTGLNKITIPKSVKSIDNYAFDYCSQLTDIYYDGTYQEWLNISNAYVDSKVNIHCSMENVSDGEGSGGSIQNPTKEVLEFKKSSYTLTYNNLTDETGGDFVILTYKADEYIIENFDRNVIRFDVEDPNILYFVGYSYLNYGSNKDVATIDCLFKAKKEGKTTVTAELPNGLSAKCDIVVTEKTLGYWQDDKVKVEFRDAKTKELIEKKSVNTNNTTVELSFKNRQSEEVKRTTTEGVLYLDESDFPIKSIEAKWKLAYNSGVDYIYKSNKSQEAWAGDRIIIYLSDDESMSNMIRKNSLEDIDYGVIQESKSLDEQILEAAEEYEDAINNYFKVFKDEYKDKSKGVSKDLGAIEERVQAIKNVPAKQKIYVLYPVYGEDYEDALCYTLASIFDGIVEEEIDLGEIDLDDDILEIDNKLTKKILNSFDGPITRTERYGDYEVTVEIKVRLFSGAFWGTYSVTKPDNGGKVIVPAEHGLITSSLDETEKILHNYLNAISSLTDDILRDALYSIIEDLISATSLDAFLEEEITESIENAFDVLENCGYGKVEKVVKGIREAYSEIKKLEKDIGSLEILNSDEELRAMYEALFDNYFPAEDISNALAKKAVELLGKAGKKLYNLLYNKLYGINKDDASITDQFKNWYQSKIMCPVDVEVYNEHGDLIAYVDTLGRHEKFLYYSDDIFIEVLGEEKFIYYPVDKSVEIRFIPTENGVMNYVLERVDDETGAARLNYYNVPLVVGQTYSQSIFNISDLETQQNKLNLKGQKRIYADEYLEKTDETAYVRISAISSSGGSIFGEEYYPKGDCATIYATPDEGYYLDGWYINDECVSTDEVFRFAAIEDVELIARFEKIKILDKSYKVSLNKELYALATVEIYNEMNVDTYIAIKDVDYQYDAMYIKCFDRNMRLQFECELQLQTNDFIEYWSSPIEKKNYFRYELYDSVGNLIASLSKKEKNDKVYRVSLFEDEFVINKNNQVELLYISIPFDVQGDLEWHSKDTSVAVVDEKGVVIAVDEGETEIVVTCKTDKSLLASCKVVVLGSSTHKHKHILVCSEASVESSEGRSVYECICGDILIVSNEHKHVYKETYYPAIEGKKAYTHTTCFCGYSFIKEECSFYTEMILPTCTTQGYTQHIAQCSCCNDYIDNYVPPVGHVYSYSDEICQSCGFNRTEGCSCKCHKTNFFIKLIWKITIFFNKLFRKNKECSCGVYHY